MAIIKTSIGEQFALQQYEFKEQKNHRYTSSMGLNFKSLSILRDDKNKITRIAFPWVFCLLDYGIPAYGLETTTICDIDESNDPITRDQLVEMLRSSYNNLYADVTSHKPLSDKIMLMPNFSDSSDQSEQCIQSALLVVGKHIFS